jgi:hypothetical protein
MIVRLAVFAYMVNLTPLPASFIPVDYDMLNDSFGLINKSESRWNDLSNRINTLNEESDSLTAYKLIYIARHGEGYHNIAEQTYGTDAWNCVRTMSGQK